MRKTATAILTSVLLAMGSAGVAVAAGAHEGGHSKEAVTMPDMHVLQDSVDEMRKEHSGHGHGHDFEIMDELSPDKLARMMSLMSDVGVTIPSMDPERGRHLFVEKGCIACHSVNGVGGNIGPTLNAEDMPRPMNSFEFAARMWRGAQAMTAMQETMMGEVISLTGQELADLVIFAHDADEQAKLTEDQIPEQFHELIGE